MEERKKATRLVGCVEKIQVELEGSSKPGETETITLPDGRVVAFVVPETFTAGQVIEVEVARTTYDEKNPAPLPPAPPSAITRDALAAFFRNGVASMERPEIKASLADPTAAVRPGPALIEIQQLELDKLGIERRAGCQAASRVPHDYADDKELQELQQAFMACAQQAYVDALEAMQPATLQKAGRIPRDKILEFFDACNTKMQLPDTKARLAAYFAEKKALPNEVIITIQKDMLETLGYEREWACSMLNRLSTDFPNDMELVQAMRVWAMTAQAACKQAAAEGDPSLRPDSKEMGEMAKTQQLAQDELQAMSVDDRTAFLAKMQKKVTVFSKLNPPDRMRYVQKLPERERIDFVKAQIIMMGQMQQQMANMNMSS